MPDFLLELRSEEIPARMQAKARDDLARLFTEHMAAAGLAAIVETYTTPRRLALIARGLPDATQGQSEERRGPRADAPAQALEGFLKSTGLTRDQLEERTDKKGTFLYAVIDKPGRATIDVLAEAIPTIVRAFPWPKAMRWGAASLSTESPRWVRPLTGIVALLGERIVPCEVAGIAGASLDDAQPLRSGAATLGHRFHHSGIITIGSADDYAAKLRACHVMLDGNERAQVIEEGAKAAAAAAGLTLVPDAGLIAENAGLTEWPVPLLGRFDPAFLDVPREVIQLTMRTNQKYFSCTEATGELAPAFVCTANIEASDGGAAIVAGNERVLSARLADAKFFWEADVKVPLEEQARKLSEIVFHEKLGTVADKVERVAKLARWLVEEGIVPPVAPAQAGASANIGADASTATDFPEMPASAGMTTEHLANLTTRAARLCKADLVTQMVAEFPELQGTIGAHLAKAQGEDEQVCNAIRDHYKPVGQGDEVPIAPVTVAVSLADKLDTLAGFFAIDEKPTGSRDPFALRRAALGILLLVINNQVRMSVGRTANRSLLYLLLQAAAEAKDVADQAEAESVRVSEVVAAAEFALDQNQFSTLPLLIKALGTTQTSLSKFGEVRSDELSQNIARFLADRLKVQQREAGVRHDLIDAVFALGGEDDLVRLLARVHALQAFVETPEGRDLLAGYKRAANILKKEGYAPAELDPAVHDDAPLHADGGIDETLLFTGEEDPLVMADDPALAAAMAAVTRPEQKPLSYTHEPVERDLVNALDVAEPQARAAVEREDFGGAMAALAMLRGPVDAFFEGVIVNDPNPAIREARLGLLARMRDAVHSVADFSKIEG